LALIDHISEIVRDSKDEDGQTNFQKSSCTLDAGVKIYASRVDSFHNETFKMLGGMNKVTQSNEAENEDEENEDDVGGKGDGEGLDEDGEPLPVKKKRSTRTVQTLEPPEQHTVKQVEEANVVDPLFQKTSALFDEGGASGLLLNNLSVHKGCTVCFDSEEVPEYNARAFDGEQILEGTTIDLSSMADILNNANRAASVPGIRITPSVHVMEDLLATLVGGVAPTTEAAKTRESQTTTDASQGVSGVSLFDFASGEGVQFAEYDEDGDGGGDEDFTDFPDGGFDDFAGGFDDDDTVGEGDGGGVFTESQGAGEGRIVDDANAGLEWVVNTGGMGGKSAWAGPTHWRFKAVPRPKNNDGTEQHDEDADATQKPSRKEKGALTFDCENPGEVDEKRFTLAANAEELLLVAAPTAVDTLLPPDLGYDPSDLARLSLRPNAAVTGLGLIQKRIRSGETAGANDGVFDGEDDFGEGFDNGFDDDDDDDANDDDTPIYTADGLVAAPRRVEKITVNYARSTKQVDVKELKCALWGNINSVPDPDPDAATGGATTHSFHRLLHEFPEQNLAGATEDISVHMAFICMLHLANEHGLVITDRPELNDLDISFLPTGVLA
jgi:condensin complex subunit 2